MSSTEAAWMFAGSLLLTTAASAVLSHRISQIGKWLSLSGSLLGILAALGANSPEISSSISALRGGNHDLGLGIVLGSNIFNLAALLGLSALVSGHVRVSWRTLMLDGAVAALVLGLTTAQLFGLMPAGWAISAIVLVMAGYITLAAMPERWAALLPQSMGEGAALQRTKQDADRDASTPETSHRPSTADLIDVLLALVCVVLASIGLVHSTLVLGANWHVRSTVLGILVLASLTGLPNLVTALQLSRSGHGAAVLSETLNSNTLNLLVGASLPMLLFPGGHLHPHSVLALWWLIGMTVLSLGLALLPRGLGRVSGALLIAVYAAFVAVILLT